MIRLITALIGRTAVVEATVGTRFNPQPPPGFVRRSDPNFYFLARKF